MNGHALKRGFFGFISTLKDEWQIYPFLVRGNVGVSLNISKAIDTHSHIYPHQMIREFSGTMPVIYADVAL